MYDVFISYCSADEEFAGFVHDHLVSHDLEVFTASISIAGGAHWSANVIDAIADSSWVVFLASRRACSSPYVLQEIGAAVATEKVLVPVVWDMSPSELPGWASQSQALDLRGHSIAQVAERLSAIATQIKGGGGRGMLVGLALVAAAFLFLPGDGKGPKKKV